MWLKERATSAGVACRVAKYCHGNTSAVTEDQEQELQEEKEEQQEEEDEETEEEEKEGGQKRKHTQSNDAIQIHVSAIYGRTWMRPGYPHHCNLPLNVLSANTALWQKRLTSTIHSKNCRLETG